MHTLENSDCATPQLWNPNAAACWSLLFSPIFGAWLHAKNWRALGNEHKAKQSMIWVYCSIIATIAVLLLPLPDAVSRGVGIGLLVAWYVSSAKDQIHFVKDNYQSSYLKKGWLKPIGLALATYVLLIAVIFIVVFAMP